MLKIPKSKHVVHVGTVGYVQYFHVKFNNSVLQVSASIDEESRGLEWEHVSVMPLKAKRMPTYQEMNFIKMLFWEPEDEVIHFFPKESEHCNLVDNCLHLWRPTGVKLPWED